MNRMPLFFLLVSLSCVCNAQMRNVTLRECIELSHENNPGVVNAGFDLKSARALKQETFAMWFPTVSAVAFGFQAMNPLVRVDLDGLLGESDAANNIKYFANTSARLAGIDPAYTTLGNGYVAAVSLMQPLFAGGRIANGNALASLGVKAADVKNRMAVRDNDDTVEMKYRTIVSLAEKKKALMQGMDFVNSLQNDAQCAFEAGIVKEDDLMKVRLKYKELESMMVKLRNGERLAKMDLFNLIGFEYRIGELDDIVLCDGFDNILSPENYYCDQGSVAGELEESKLLQMAVDAKKLERKIAIGEGLPQIGVGASAFYGKLISDPTMNGIVYASVNIPITDWSKTARKVQRCEYEIEKAQNDKEYLDRQLTLKVNKEWLDLQDAWDQLEISRDAVALSEMLESRKMSEYGAGMCTMSDLLQSQSELQQARSKFVDCCLEYCNAVSTWQKH